MFGRRKEPAPFSPLTDCSLLTLGFDTQTYTQEQQQMVPDRTTEAYQKALRAGRGTFGKETFNSCRGTYIEETVKREVIRTSGTLSCRRMVRQDVQPLAATVEDNGRGREIIAADLGRQVTALYCEACPYRRAGNLDPLAAARYDLEVAQTETAAAELETQRLRALHELERIGRPGLPELPGPPAE